MLSPVLSKPAEISRSVVHGEGVAVDRGRAARSVPRHSASSVPPPEAGHKMPPFAAVLSCPGCNQWARKSCMGFKNTDWQKLNMERRVTQIGNVQPQPGREHRPCGRRALPVTTLGHRLSRPRGSQL